MQKLSSNMSVFNHEKGLGKPVLILLIVLGVLLVGGAGYMIGSNNAEADAKAKYDQQVQTLQEDLDTARAAAGDAVEEGQDAVTEGQQTLESLQAENAQLKTTIEQQNAKIAELEQQLEDAQTDDTQQPQ